MPDAQRPQSIPDVVEGLRVLPSVVAALLRTPADAHVLPLLPPETALEDIRAAFSDFVSVVDFTGLARIPIPRTDVDVARRSEVLRVIPVETSGLPNADCGRRGFAFDPTACLAAADVFDYRLELQVAPFTAGLVRWTRATLGTTEWAPTTFEVDEALHAELQDIDALPVQLERMIMQTLRSPSAAVLFLHPLAGNCRLIPYLGLQLHAPELLYLPVNPSIPPPISVLPSQRALRRDAWAAQCSLERTVFEFFSLVFTTPEFATIS